MPRKHLFKLTILSTHLQVISKTLFALGFHYNPTVKECLFTHIFAEEVWKAKKLFYVTINLHLVRTPFHEKMCKNEQDSSRFLIKVFLLSWVRFGALGARGVKKIHVRGDFLHLLQICGHLHKANSTKNQVRAPTKNKKKKNDFLWNPKKLKNKKFIFPLFIAKKQHTVMVLSML